jgi:hypothetical protein
VTARSTSTAPFRSLNSFLSHWRGVGLGAGDRRGFWGTHRGCGGLLFGHRGRGEGGQRGFDACRFVGMRQEDDDRRAGAVIVEPDDPKMSGSV